MPAWLPGIRGQGNELANIIFPAAAIPYSYHPPPIIYSVYLTDTYLSHPSACLCLCPQLPCPLHGRTRLLKGIWGPSLVQRLDHPSGHPRVYDSRWRYVFFPVIIQIVLGRSALLFARRLSPHESIYRRPFPSLTTASTYIYSILQSTSFHSVRIATPVGSVFPLRGRLTAVKSQYP